MDQCFICKVSGNISQVCNCKSAHDGCFNDWVHNVLGERIYNVTAIKCKDCTELYKIDIKTNYTYTGPSAFSLSIIMYWLTLAVFYDFHHCTAHELLYAASVMGVPVQLVAFYVLHATESQYITHCYTAFSLLHVAPSAIIWLGTGEFVRGADYVYAAVCAVAFVAVAAVLIGFVAMVLFMVAMATFTTPRVTVRIKRGAN